MMRSFDHSGEETSRKRARDDDIDGEATGNGGDNGRDDGEEDEELKHQVSSRMMCQRVGEGGSAVGAAREDPPARERPADENWPRELFLVCDAFDRARLMTRGGVSRYFCNSSCRRLSLV